MMTFNYYIQNINEVKKKFITVLNVFKQNARTVQYQFQLWKKISIMIIHHTFSLSNVIICFSNELPNYFFCIKIGTVDNNLVYYSILFDAILHITY